MGFGVMTVSSARQTSSATRRTPLYYFASIGAVLAFIEVYLLVRWVSGPNFKAVPYGPSEPPTWMKIFVNVSEVAFWGVALIVLYRVVVQPWRRERRIGFDGLMVLSAIACSLYDPLNAYFHTWFGYNSYFLNRGTAMTGIPGWQSVGEPASALAWPILFIPPLYAVLFLGITVLCCYFMRKAKSRWPGMNWLGLAAIAFVTVFVMDLLIEGQILMRLGAYEETGWSFSWLDSTYSHNPLRNIVCFSFVFTFAALLRYYKNDRGETLVERGASRVTGGPGKVTGLRFLAVLTATMACLTIGYHIPMAITTLVNPNAAWHDGMVNSSFLNNHECGAGTNRECPKG
jgi:hypothetical protein